jgi:hypothetical protein
MRSLCYKAESRDTAQNRVALVSGGPQYRELVIAQTTLNDTGSGVKIPFLIHMVPGSPRSELWTTSTMRIQKVQDNVQVEAGKFVKPQSKPAQ